MADTKNTQAPAPLEPGDKLTVTAVVDSVIPQPTVDGPGTEVVRLHIVSAGDNNKDNNNISDGNTLVANIAMHITNPEMVGRVKQGDYFDVVLTKREL